MWEELMISSQICFIYKSYFQEIIEQLSSFKTRLFGLNLGVHNFLATLSCSQMVDEKQVNLAIHLKEEVVEMYGLWDKSHHQTIQDINNAEEAMWKYNHLQEKLQQLKRLLDQDANLKKKNTGRKPRKKGKTIPHQETVESATQVVASVTLTFLKESNIWLLPAFRELSI